MARRGRRAPRIECGAAKGSSSQSWRTHRVTVADANRVGGADRDGRIPRRAFVGADLNLDGHTYRNEHRAQFLDGTLWLTIDVNERGGSPRSEDQLRRLVRLHSASNQCVESDP